MSGGDPTRLRAPVATAFLFASFTVGTSKAVVTGIMPDVARGLPASVADVGGAVAAHDLALAVGAPLLTAFVAAMPRRAVLVALLLLCGAGDVLVAMAPGFAAFLVARIVIAPVHGAAVGIAAVAVALLVAPQRRGSAVALVLTGVVLAWSVGVPVGALLAQHVDWRTVFLALAGLQLVAAIGMALVLPDFRAVFPPRSAREEFASLREPGVAIALTVTIIVYAGLLSINTYLVPLLMNEGRVPRADIPLTLSAIGVAPLIGTLVGGRLADRAPRSTIHAVLALLAPALACISLLAGHRTAMVTLVVTCAVVASALNPAIEAWIIAVAPRAPTLASSLRLSAVNLGMALGAAIGALVLRFDAGYGALGWTAAALIAIALLVARAAPVPGSGRS